MKPLNRKILSIAVPLAVLAAPLGALAVPTPEGETLAISKTLKPIADAEWSQIAGERITEAYTVVDKDTLYDISKRLFGDGKYWPKIWALNNVAGLTNPHFIRPGKLIAFLPGTGTSLPGVEVSDATPATRIGVVHSSPRLGSLKGDWRDLPPQPWEALNVKLPKEADADGFDRRSRVIRKFSQGFELEAIASSEEIEPLGTIRGSKAISLGVGLTEEIFIAATEDLAIGQNYAIASEPTELKRPEGEKTDGYSYRIIGKVEITGRSEDLFIGRVYGVNEVIERDMFIIQLPDRVEIGAPVPGPSAIEASVFVDPKISVTIFAQHRQVFIDRGSSDGIAPNMVFRTHLFDDPQTGKTITETKVHKLADIQVLQVTENFSAGIVLNTTQPIDQYSTATLLTDVSDVGAKGQNPIGTVVNPGMDEEPAASEDELDQLDDGKDLQDFEKRELEQLETWKGNPDGTTEGEATPPTPPMEPELDSPLEGDDLSETPPTVTAPLEEPAESLPAPLEEDEELTSESPAEPGADSELEGEDELSTSTEEPTAEADADAELDDELSEPAPTPTRRPAPKRR